MSEVAEKACVYAALILADEKLEVTADKLSALIAAADLEVESVWPTIFASALEGKNVSDMIANVGAASSAAPSAAAAPAAGGAPAAAEKEDKKKKEEEKEESDDDMGFGLFD